MVYIKYVGNDGDIITNLSPMSYTLMVEAISDDDPPQFALDIVGPITLIGGLTTCKCNMITISYPFVCVRNK